LKHALVVGGTGMLADVSRWFLDNGYHVSIIARNPERMNRIIEKNGSNSHVTKLVVDYRNSGELKEKVNATIKQNGNIDTVVAWIHSTAPDALKKIAKEISISDYKWELFHVLGSSSDLNLIKSEVKMPKSCLYYQVQLGFVMEDAGSRWLTNNEISDGVIKAIEERKKIQIVGQIDPWGERP